MLKRISLFLIMVLFSSASFSQADNSTTGTPEPFSIQAGEVYRFSPDGMDTDLSVYVAIPDGPVPANGYPVLYAFDADLSFAPLASMTKLVGLSARRAGMAPPLVVGIGYADRSDFAKRRTFDMTPAAESYDLPHRPNGRPWPKVGGGDAFADVLINEIKPFIAAHYAIDTNNETLAGHSLGGLMTLHILLTRSDAFDRYVAASPSLWFNGRKTMSELIAWQEATAGAGKKKIPLRLSVGGLEETVSPWALKAGMTKEDRTAWLKANRMVQNAQDLAGALEAADGVVDVSFEIYSGLDHMPASLPALYHALQFAIDPQVFQP